MDKTAPSPVKIAALVGFALSCFGLLMFLWISFGGAVPLGAQGYRFKAYFPEAALLVNEADVRISGLTVGKVKSKELRREGGMLVELELDPRFAPIPSDTRAILRQKTLLGQIYIELTQGSEEVPKLADGGTLPRASVAEPTEIDEVISTFDKPTRRAFQGFTREIAATIDGNGENLNDAIGTLPNFVFRGDDLLEIVDEQEPAVQRLVRNAGVVFRTLTEREGELRSLVGNANGFFGALASRRDALAETIQVLPVFLDESRLTFQRLERFAGDTKPLVDDLIPVARDIPPTARNVGKLAPDLESLFEGLEVVIDESGRTLPQASRFLRGAEPLLRSAHRFLPELNPFLSFASFQRGQVADFITNGGSSLAGALPPTGGGGPRHYLRQFGIISSRGLSIARERPAYDRGNAYPAPNYLARSRGLGTLEAFDCKPAGGEQPIAKPDVPPCFVQPPSLFNDERIPSLERGEASLVAPPGENDGSEPAKP
ncbi:MAG: MCE family protein [Thermoleophilaceae bacterium]|nr:MCE family protein [Thermoleophilaceae bacterium]